MIEEVSSSFKGQEHKLKIVSKLTAGGAIVYHICSCLFSEPYMSMDSTYMKIFSGIVLFGG